MKNVRKENSYVGRGGSNKETAPSKFKAPQEPVGGGKVQPKADGYHCHKSKSGVLRNSGHPRASRIGKK